MSDVEEDYEVEAIVNKRFKSGKVEYNVKWVGYPSSDNTWEPVENLECPELIEEYEKSKNSKGPTPGSKRSKSSPNHVSNKKLKSPPEKKKRGFARGLKAEAVVGATNDPGDLWLLVKWKGVDEAELVRAKEANMKIPQIVIKFYEERLNWTEED
eukprot:TRINITY_DN4374_c0_g1_i3.p1 TRINITY_DN4374_c0_g1~~TRINITY_DN4374_c0_g1_i3.p1  ORF type:complete len:155 (+),score=69.67 TRINITY_DN4374_c0_g1_i3:53-517(+)